MTKAEFLALEQHDRIKYTGLKSLEQVYGSSMPKVWKTKGVVVEYAKEQTKYEENRKNAWASPKAVGKELVLSWYGGYQNGIDPAEWTLVEKRPWIAADVEYKSAKATIKRNCSNFKRRFKALIETHKMRMEWELMNLPLDKKLKVIMDLDPEYKKWFGILNANADEALTAIEKNWEDTDATPTS